MKKISFFNTLYRRSVLCLVLLMSACMVCLTSCSDDDEESGGEGIDAGAPYTGVWVMTHIKMAGDGETGDYQVTPALGLENKITLLENMDYEYYGLVKGDTPDEDEEEEHKGKWNFSDNKLILKSDEGLTYTLTILTWTANKLVTYQEENIGDSSYSETRTYQKQ